MPTKNKTIRETLIDAIIEFANDELEDRKDLIELAKESDEQLIFRLISICRYYIN